MNMPGLILEDKSEKSSAPNVHKALVKFFPKVRPVNLPHVKHGGEKVTAGDLNIPLDDGSLLAIERKTVNDFLSSIKKRHIFHQIEVMASKAKFSAVIVTGVLSFTNITDMAKADGQETGWKGVSVRAVIDEIQYSGCPVRFCPTTQYCQSILEIYNLVNGERSGGVYKNRIFTFPPVDERIQFLAQLPGVHLKLADNILTFAGKMDGNADELGYGTLAGALHWISILTQIHPEERPKGWGKEKILTQRKFLSLAPNEYFAIVKELNKDIIEIGKTAYAKTF